MPRPRVVLRATGPSQAAVLGSGAARLRLTSTTAVASVQVRAADAVIPGGSTAARLTALPTSSGLTSGAVQGSNVKSGSLAPSTVASAVAETAVGGTGVNGTTLTSARCAGVSSAGAWTASELRVDSRTAAGAYEPPAASAPTASVTGIGGALAGAASGVGGPMLPAAAGSPNLSSTLPSDVQVTWTGAAPSSTVPVARGEVLVVVSNAASVANVAFDTGAAVAFVDGAQTLPAGGRVALMVQHSCASGTTVTVGGSAVAVVA